MPRPQPPVPGVRLAGSRLSPQTNTSLFCALCPHSCAPGSYFPVGTTHPQIAASQARLTLEFFEDVLPEKKVHLVDMSSLSFLLSQDVTTHNTNTQSALMSSQTRAIRVEEVATHDKPSCRHRGHTCPTNSPTTQHATA